MTAQLSILQTAWSALGQDPAALEGVRPGGAPELSSRLAVDHLVRDSVASASLAAALLNDPAPDVSLDSARIRTAVTSDRHIKIDGKRPDVWAELSGFWPASDGWVRTHANYPHHRARLLHALDLNESATKKEFGARLQELETAQIEQRAAYHGAIAVQVRTPSQWRTYPQSQAVRADPLVTYQTDDHVGASHAHPLRDQPQAPLAGVRVLDLTRVIAGPVATRSLALLGADVLRVDAPHLEEPQWQHLDTGAGKRSTLLDLHERRDRAVFDDLLAGADVLVTGYRLAALDAFDLDPQTLTQRHPGLIIGRLSAWGTEGPWALRRGFDSIVQAATGIAVIEADGAPTPGALPAQALDHSAGYLLAAGLLTALRHRRTTGTGATVEVSLARIAQELLQYPLLDTRPPGSGLEATTTTVDTLAGPVTYAQPALQYTDGPNTWPAPSRPWGKDLATWRP
ncbi:CoA transferase [Kocuria sp. NPDC057446]|uniref:CoA transferase n=1 Tax=Kocuria sp. NPDC057446 TaxID=3346137 RepID=UPI003673C550